MLNYRTTLAALLGAAIVLLVTGCATSATPGGEEAGTDAPSAATLAETLAATPTDAQKPTQAQATQDASSGAESTPGALPTQEILIPMTAKPGAADSIPADLLALLKADAAQKAGVDVSQVEVISAQAVTWNDGSLGCPKPGVMYTQALVPGYQVILSVGGSQVTYNAALGGAFVECRPGLTSPKLSSTEAPKPPVSPGDPAQ